MACPKCGINHHQSKAGRNRSGSQRYQCTQSGAKYTPQCHHHGYPRELRQQAIKLYVDGMNFRRIARHLGVNHQTVVNWVNAASVSATTAPMPSVVETVELDELHTFVGDKKKQLTSSQR